jgi:hypothetical protein
VATEASAPVSAGAVPTDRGLDRATWLTQETVVAPSLDLPEEVDDDSDNSLPDLPTAGSAAEDSLAGFGSVDWTRAPRALAGKADVAGRRSQLPENIADRLPVSSRADIFASDESRKHIESSAGKALVSSAPTVGTHVAKAQGFMPTAPAIPSAVDATQPSRVEFSVRDVSGTPSATSGESAPAEAIPLLAGKAVEAVLQAADRLAAGDRSSVRLEFAMGDSELSVRVALRDNAVRATFQTDSPELRAALVHEWQAVTAEPRERTFQFAPPAFQSSQGDSWSQGNLTGEFSRQQRDGQPAHAGEREFTGWSTGRNDPDSGEPAVSEPGRGRAELPAYSQHLHTLA